MNKELAIEVGIYVLCVALASFLWIKPLALAFCFLVISIFMLYRWHDRSDLVFYFVAFILGPAGEAVAVHFGAWEYSKPLYLIPIWLPFVWGIVALFLKRLSETLLTMR